MSIHTHIHKMNLDPYAHYKQKLKRGDETQRKTKICKENFQKKTEVKLA